MKSFSQWAESVSQTMAGDREMYGNLGNVAAQEVDNIKNALLELAKVKPNAFLSIVRMIRTQMAQLVSAGKVDGNFSGSAGSKIVSASPARDESSAG